MTVKETWKPVTIGGITGILMGAGAMYSVQAMASGNEAVAVEDDGLRVATVSDGLSFGKAFDAARAEVGPGGVFRWRGHIYNTYTEAEWKAMSAEDKQLFASQVKPEVSAADVDTKQIAEAEMPVEDDVRVADDDVQVAQATADEQEPVREEVQTRAEVTSWNEIAQDDNDVRIVGYKEIAVAPGRTITMQELDVNGQRVAVIDVDKDGVPDLAMTDLNHNQQMDEGEVIDLHTGEAISFANDDPGTQDVPDVDTFIA